MSTKPIRIGSRGSQLALWQANFIATQLRQQGHAVEIEIIRTAGDRMQDPAFAANPEAGLSPNGTGIFIKELEDALADGRIDLAVHSLKDLPVEIDPRFTLAAIPPRADARDAFVCEDHWGLHMLPEGSRVATTSPRRQAMLLALRPDLTFVEMRGNIDTRLRKWSEGEADALVLAAAGLDRIGRTESVHQRFSIDELTPAPGQGALALQTRVPQGFSLGSHTPQGFPVGSDARQEQVPQGFSLGSHTPQESLGALAPRDAARDQHIYTVVRALNCCDTEFATTAERAVLAALGGGCQLPLGAYCHLTDDRWHLHTMVAAPDGEAVAHYIEKSPRGISPIELGELAAQGLIARGAKELLSAAYAVESI